MEVAAPRAQAGAARCPDHRRGLIFYRLRYADWHELRGVKVKVSLQIPRGCAHTLWRAKLWKARAVEAREEYWRWHKEQQRFMLRDFEFRPGNRAWHKAVEEVQRVFPGTSGWLLSCSAAEGGHGRWVGYGGVGYSTWLRDSNTVGGPMQFRWQTFKGMYRRALDHIHARGFKVHHHLTDPGDDVAWRSAIGQALAGGWARYTGNDDSHWSASWGRGC